MKRIFWTAPDPVRQSVSGPQRVLRNSVTLDPDRLAHPDSLMKMLQPPNGRLGQCMTAREHQFMAVFGQHVVHQDIAWLQ